MAKQLTVRYIRLEKPTILRILTSSEGTLKYFVVTDGKLTKADWMWIEQEVVYGL